MVTFIDDMAARYADCDLVICRAGALTIAEVSAAGVASILVPFPYAVDDHQTFNAKFLSDRNAAVLHASNCVDAGDTGGITDGFESRSHSWKWQ